MNAGRSKESERSDAELARVLLLIADEAGASAIICVTERGAFARRLASLVAGRRLVAATTNSRTYNSLIRTGMEAMRLPLQAIDKYRQVRHALSFALSSTRVSVGDVVVCAIGNDVYPVEGYLIVLTEIEPSLEGLAITDLLKLTDGVRPKALQAALTVACRIGRAGRRGQRIGTIFMLGDSRVVLEGSRQLIPNPFHGHDSDRCQLTNPDVHDAVVELAKLDGAFVVRGDGLIQTAGTFLATTQVDIELPAGLGTRHAAAAAVTARTAATAVVVSATDGYVRVFSEGALVLRMDPDIDYRPISVEGCRDKDSEEPGA
jgi:diadenylate cyclase